MTQRIEPSLTWLEELNLCFFQKNDSKNGNFLSMTQRIDSFLSVTQRIEFLSFFFFSKKPLKELSFSQKKKKDTKNWTFFQYDSKIFFNMTRRIEPFFLTWLKDFVFFLLKKKTQRIWLFYVSQTCTFFSKKNIFSKKKKKTTQRIDPLLSLRLSKWNFFEIRIRLTELIFFQYDSQNWKTFFVWLSELIFFSRNMTWLIELNLFLWTSFQDDSKSWSLSSWLKELNLSCFPMWLKELKSFFSKCLKEFNPSFIWTFFYMSQRTSLYFSIWLKELNFFFQKEYDSKNWPFKKKGWKNWFFLKYDSKNWTFYLSMIQRIEPLFEYESKNRTHFCLNPTQWIDPFFLNVTQKLKFWLKKLSKKLNFFLKKNSKLNFSSHDSKNWTFFFQNDSKNWTLF